MKPPIFVRELSDEERKRLEAGLRAADAFVLRRCQILLASARGKSPPKIAQDLGCASQTVRNAIRAFNERGLDALTPGSSRPKRVHAAFDEQSAEALREMLHRSPREFSRESSLWTLEMAADVAFEEGITPKRVSGETIRATLLRLLSVKWMRAKLWITSPDPLYERKKAARPADGDLRLRSGVGHRLFGRMLVEPEALPTLNAWSEDGEPLRLIQRSVAKDDPEPKAISCYGLYLPELDGQTWLRFVDGRPVSCVTTQFLGWCAEKLEEMGKKVFLLISGTTQAGTSPKRSDAGSENTIARSKTAVKE